MTADLCLSIDARFIQYYTICLTNFFIIIVYANSLNLIVVYFNAPLNLHSLNGRIVYAKALLGTPPER